SYQRETGGSVLRVGYVTPARAGLQLVESDQPANSLLPAELGSDAQPGDEVAIGARRWRAYPVARGGGQGLVLAEDGRIVVLVGAVSAEDLRTLAASLR